jgi:hypothetical protein
LGWTEMQYWIGNAQGTEREGIMMSGGLMHFDQ